jgi:hypothetical protein
MPSGGQCSTSLPPRLALLIRDVLVAERIHPIRYGQLGQAIATHLRTSSNWWLQQSAHFGANDIQDRRDSRSASYIARYGDRCWEVDILPGAVIEAELDADINSWLDHDLWGRRISEIERARKLL